MQFVQIVEMSGGDLELVRKANHEWWTSTEGKRAARRELLLRDHNGTDRCQLIVFFDDYESAMKNSELPETQAGSQKFREASGSVRFHDLDLIEEWA